MEHLERFCHLRCSNVLTDPIEGRVGYVPSGTKRNEKVH